MDIIGEIEVASCDYDLMAYVNVASLHSSRRWVGALLAGVAVLMPHTPISPLGLTSLSWIS